MSSVDPFYLAFDMSQSSSSNRKQDIVRDIVAGLRSASGRSVGARIELLLFAQQTHVVPATPLAELDEYSLRPPWVGSSSSYAAAFQKLESRIRASVPARGSQPLVFFVTDNSDHTGWQPELNAFVSSTDPILVPITYGFADAGTSRAMAYPPGAGRHLPREEPDVARAVVAEVMHRLSGVDPTPGYRGSSELDFGAGAGDPSPTRLSPLPSAAGPGHRAVPVHAQADAWPPRPAKSSGSVPFTDMWSGDAHGPARDPGSEGAAHANGAAESQPAPDVVPPAATRQTPDAVQGGFTPYAVGEPGQADKVLPLPDPEEWNRPDTVCDGVCFLDADKRVLVELRAASVRGSSHRYYGTVRQDEYRFRRTEDQNFLVCAVSDGVSSGRLSHRAAVFITQKGCELLAERLRDGGPEQIDWTELIHELAAGVVGIGSALIARERGGSREEVTPEEVVQQMAATAVFAVVDLRPWNEGVPVHLCSIGDSSAWVLRRGRTWEPQKAVKNEGAAIASSKTAALPILPPERVLPDQIWLDRGDVLVLMTDGIGDPLGDGTGPVGRFLEAEWKQPPAALAFAAQVDFSRRSHDDDRTAVAVWPGYSR